MRELLTLALEHPDACYDPEKHTPKSLLVQHYLDKLQSKSEMLEDFFALVFKKEEEFCLIAMPVIMNGVKPFVQELPMFILRLATEVDYSDEYKCI